MQTKQAPRYPTKIQIRLDGATGNVHYVLGVCRHIMRELELGYQERQEFANDTRLDGSKDYQQILDTCQNWFGLIYIKRNN